MGLRRPKPVSDTCEDNMTLSVPPGAVVLDQSSKRNEYGEFAYLKYLLPERAVPLQRKLPPKA